MAPRRDRNGKKPGWKARIFSAFILLAAVACMPTTILLIFGMLPTIAAAVADKSRTGAKSLSIGAMNLAGCMPFLIELWSKGNTSDLSVQIVTDPRTLIVIWLSAGVGYLINWSMAGIVTTMMVQRSGARLKDIKRRQTALAERWGREVTGEVPLDPEGFPLEKEEAAGKGKEKSA